MQGTNRDEGSSPVTRKPLMLCSYLKQVKTRTQGTEGCSTSPNLSSWKDNGVHPLGIYFQTCEGNEGNGEESMWVLQQTNHSLLTRMHSEETTAFVDEGRMINVAYFEIIKASDLTSQSVTSRVLFY